MKKAIVLIALLFGGACMAPAAAVGTVPRFALESSDLALRRLAQPGAYFDKAVGRPPEAEPPPEAAPAFGGKPQPVTVVASETPKAQPPSGGPGQGLQTLARKDVPAVAAGERSKAVAGVSILPGDVLQPIREVLMVGFMNDEAWRITRDTGYVTFFSRTRNTLWTKGETSGNRLAVRQIFTDCDDDTVLVKVDREGHGNVCHTGRRSCFYTEVPVAGRAGGQQ